MNKNQYMRLSFIRLAVPLKLILASLLTGCAGPGFMDKGTYEAARPQPPMPIAVNYRSGSIYQSGSSLGLFEDFRARQIGDTLTVILSESTQAAKSSDTSIDKSNTSTITNPIFAGAARDINGDTLDFELGSERSFSGESGANQSNSLQGELTVTVAEVYANGNLYVQGEKWIKINQGNEYIRIRGIVRPADITPENTVASTRVADAWISYGGNGALAEANSGGWLARFFASPIFPF